MGTIAGEEGCCLVNEAEHAMRWTAAWISPVGAKPRNYYFLARKDFTLRCPPARVLLRITADTRYAVYLNGRFVGNGPVRGTHRRYFADTYNVTPLIARGRNWLAVEAHCCLKPSYTQAPFYPALLAEIPGLTRTDATWRVRPDPSHVSQSPTYTPQIGFSEWKLMTEEIPGWMTGADGNEQWQVPWVLGRPSDFGGRVVVARPIAALARDVVRPTIVVGAGRVPPLASPWHPPPMAPLIAAENHTPFSGCPAAAVAFDPTTGGMAIRPARDGQGVYVILDFGGEVFGHLRLDLRAPAGTVVDTAHNDALREGRLGVNPSKRYQFADRFVLRKGEQAIVQRLHSRGFRYLQLVFRNFKTPIQIRDLALIRSVYFREPAAEFSCSDPYLNRLWMKCVNTVRACSADTFMDCPWREQTLWTGDQAVTSLYYLALTADPVYAAHNLRFAADGARPDGLIPAVYPSQMQRFFPMISALWTFALSDYYLYTGDLEVVRTLRLALEKGLSVYDTWRDDDGLVPDQEGMWNIIDWGYTRGGGLQPAAGGKTTVLNMLIAAAYKRAARLEGALGRQDHAADYDAKSRLTMAALQAALWDKTRGAYRDCTEFAAGSAPSYSQHPLAVGLYHDLLAEPYQSAAVRSLLAPSLVQAEFIFQHYVLQALVKYGRARDALMVVRSMWRDNVEADGDTIWELHTGRRADKYATQDCLSLCHAYGCAPLIFMQSVVLGVSPLAPGFAKFSFAPKALDLAAARGAVPTPHGLIRIEWRRSGNRLRGVLHVPEGTCAVLPRGQRYEPGRHAFEISA